MLTQQQQLVFDTIHFRPTKTGNSFFVNEPGLKLISADASYLPAVKDAMLEASKEKNWRHLFGMDHVIAAFLVLSMKYAPETLVPFIRSLPQAFLRDVVTLIAFPFHKTKEGSYRFGVPPTLELVEFVNELANDEDQAMQKAAQRTLRMMERDTGDASD